MCYLIPEGVDLPKASEFAVLVQQLANHLKGKEVVLEAEQLTRSLTTVYGESLVMGKQYMFWEQACHYSYWEIS